jgi:protein SCO1/2
MMNSRHARHWLSLAVFVSALASGVGSSWGDPVPGHDHSVHSTRASASDHAAHSAVAQSQRYTATTVHYDAADVTLIDESGTAVSLRSLLDSSQPIALNFIFTTCTTICPVMTATFAQMQRELGATAEQLRVVSISIDPEYDRPDVLKAYAEQFDAGVNWTFLTGDGPDIVAALASFDAYTGSKMNHQPITLLRARHASSWTRIQGLASSADLAREVAAKVLD